MEKQTNTKPKKLLFLYVALLLLTTLTMFSLWKAFNGRQEQRDYPEIRKEGILRVVTEYNSVGYYASGDSTLGTQYELCKSIEKYSGLNIEIHLENNLEKCIDGLEKGQYDIIARYIPVTTEYKQFINFTKPIGLDKQVLVQRTSEHNNGAALIRNQMDLAGKTIYIPKNSPGILRLQNLSEEIADMINIQEEELYNSEQLLYMVASGDIDYAVVEREIALKNKKTYPQIDIDTDISFTQLQSWAVRKNAPILLDSLNLWLERGKAIKNNNPRI